MLIKRIKSADFSSTYEAMQSFTEARNAQTPDELWLCEHPPVFTLGLASKPEHLLSIGDIPVVQTNRGGQVTYHGPGQVVAYPLVDLKRLNIYVKEYVYRLEQAIIQTLESYGVEGIRVKGAPGIYVRAALQASSPQPSPADAGEGASPFTGLAKIAALGIKVSRGCAYHGVALNVAMDLEPFSRINPCGYEGLETVDLATLGTQTPWEAAAQRLAERLNAHLSEY
jgi:lipoyl(octanoyl) transferase